MIPSSNLALGLAGTSPSASAPAILDVEASGFGRGGYPIEVGFVLGDGSAYCTLIRPVAGWTHWDPAAEAVHGIPRDLLVRRGRDVHNVARELNVRLAGEVVYSDGWGNDFAWLGLLFEEAEILPRFRLESVRSLLTDDEAAVWHTVKHAVEAERNSSRHRASADAQVLQLAVLRVKNVFRAPLRD
jgi:hypothetical protein